jgi:hypothetical protein
MIRAEGRSRYIGCYETEEEAAAAYDDVAREAFGEFACVNIPREGERPAVPLNGEGDDVGSLS